MTAPAKWRIVAGTMSLFKQNTETALMKKLADIRRERFGWSAAVLNSDPISADQRRELRSDKAQAVFRSLMDCDGILPYFCRDHDIFFLFRTMPKHCMEQLKQALCRLLPQYSPDDVMLDSFFDYYHLSEEFNAVYERAAQKEALFEEERRRVASRTLEGEAGERGPYQWSDELFDKALAERYQRRDKLFLVVEDDDLVRDLARTVLRQEFAVRTAEDGDAALMLYNELAPDLVFLDINMPDMDGITLLERLMQYDSEAVIVMFSGNKSSDMVARALQKGAKGYVVKPFTPDALLKYARKFAFDESAADRGVG